jgi:hypothetical protein
MFDIQVIYVLVTIVASDLFYAALYDKFYLFTCVPPFTDVYFPPLRYCERRYISGQPRRVPTQHTPPANLSHGALQHGHMAQ